MAFVVKDRVKVTSTTTGTGTFTLGAAAGISFQDFSVIGDGNTTSYTIVDPSTGAFEVGIGTYTASGTTLSRDVVLESSNSGSLVNFAAGLKEVFVAYPAERAVVTSATPTNGDILVFSSGLFAPQALPSSIPSGTVMLFVQTTAPVGFTKSTTHNNKALRVVSGTASTGGTVAFTTAFASQAVTGTIANTTATGTVGNTTLVESQMPSHNHSQIGVNNLNGLSAGSGAASGATTNTGSKGGNGAHNHSFTGTAHNHTFTGTAIDMAVQYVDTIIATKD